MIALILATMALAADVTPYPWQASVEVPAVGPDDSVRVAIPVQLRSFDDPSMATDLLLLDPQGEPVPVAWLRGHAEPRLVELMVRPTADPDIWTANAGVQSLDGLWVELDGDDQAARVRVDVLNGQGDWQPIGAPTLVWKHPWGEQARVDLPPTTGTVRVRLEHLHRAPTSAPHIQGMMLRSQGADPSTIELAVPDPVVREDGWVQYALALPHPLPAGALHLDIGGDVFDRGVALRTQAVDSQESMWGSERIRRVRLGSVHVESTRVDTPALDSNTLILLIEGDPHQPPLPLRGVRLELEGLDALILAPESGAYEVYGGASPNTSSPSDHQTAAHELFDRATGAGVVGQVGANPAFVPPEQRAGLAKPGTTLARSKWTWAVPLTGTGALARIPLNEHALTHARSDHGDLRLIDDKGRQIPYVLRRRPVDNTWGVATVTRREDGAHSRLRVQVPHPSVPIADLTLHTEAPVFSRPIQLSQAQGVSLRTRRAVHWHGTGAPQALRLSVEDALGSELLISIDNGDDPPLPVGDVELSWPAWELIAQLPQGKSELLYGNKRASAPSYDLLLLSTEIERRSLGEVVPGEPEAIYRAPRTLPETLTLSAGVGVLVLGLLLALLSLLRATPAVVEEAAGDKPTV